MGMPLRIPAQLLPADGRFGSGPSKVRPAQVEVLASSGAALLGTSHRQPPVKALVGRIRSGLSTLFDAPEGYEVVLGNGGSTAFWEVATACLVEHRAQHASFGEFGGKFAAATARAPFLAAPQVLRAEPGTVALLEPSPDGDDAVDVHATPHNETSTGAMITPTRVPGSTGLMLVDATSGAGALPVDLTETDVYYFAPQKAFAADGGLWLAVASPAAIERAARIEAAASSSGRWVPEFLSFTTALTNSRLDQTLNTPAVATLVLLAEQVDWLLAQGGLEWSVARTRRSADILYGWAEARDWATPFVAEQEHRSTVVGTIDLDAAIDATAVVKTLRENGVYDVFPYRKLGRNQLRVGMFPAVDPADVEALTQSVDYVVDHL
ncbi:phosphoserine aminotransferase [Xylanimonas cellulosilytica DSM 15894]|uniref:phosphoserine transaminase n=1 Tax=Xylanimonas cellulosilytica (strain DSM 15894 / JCM 12276 / CECT 5975 / KCTC 9989 / LMG 20990 / NBRC 107835 / XIL07) TaxID=446471 RepID=D1BYI8_XYLCX|nr:phosphoserine transaminase [Xylanimonas cellulosilytica]ACZ31860.1 phosphoserine aminotransferase [Xylanimonas cellulosilytica DSM 15894]